jgi:hypothetical protein
VHEKAGLGDLLPVVAQAAHVVEEDAPAEVLKRVALAAQGVQREASGRRCRQDDAVIGINT